MILKQQNCVEILYNGKVTKTENYENCSYLDISKKNFENIEHVSLLQLLVPVMDTFLLELAVCGYHVYKEIWSSILGEELQCFCEIGSIHDLYAVKVVKTGMGTVGHLPKEISMPCHLFLRKGGSIGCTIAGVRQYSVDLPQGSLEIPCKLMFTGERKSVDKLKQLLHKVPSLSPVSFR